MPFNVENATAWEICMNIGLVLAGGMAKGAYEVGALNALEEFLPKNEIKYMSCSSIGTLNGYAYVTDRMDWMDSVWDTICGDKDRQIFTRVLRSDLLDRKIDELDLGSDEIKPVFYTSMLDLGRKQINYKDISNVPPENRREYLLASAAFPIYRKPVKIGERKYYDGALIDNIPVYPMMKHEMDYIICIHFDDTAYKFENSEFDNKIIEITFYDDTIFKDYFIFNKDDIERMKKEGYEKTKRVLADVFSKGYDNLEAVYEGIIRNDERNAANRKLRLTTDVVVSNFNKLTQRFTKRHITP